MIRNLLIALLMFSSVSAFAAKDPSASKPQQTFIFKYKYQGENLEVRRSVASYETALEQAAQTCFDHFRRNHNGKLSEDQGLDIIDVCANPRS